jgi:hypothetical protein
MEANNNATAAPASKVDAQAVADFCQDRIDEIDKLGKKSNYHNARKSAYKSIRDLINPPAPKPEKEKKSKAKAKAAGTADVVDGEEVEAVNEPTIEEVGDTGGA